MPRFALAVPAAAAALATAAVLAASGSAQTAPTTLHLVSKHDASVGYFPKGRPRSGEGVGFGDKVTGDDTGFDRGACTIIGRRMLCTIEVHLSKGTLGAQGLLPQRSHANPVAIVGGTGAYDGARGTALVTDVNDSTSTVDVTLKP